MVDVATQDEDGVLSLMLLELQPENETFALKTSSQRHVITFSQLLRAHAIAPHLRPGAGVDGDVIRENVWKGDVVGRSINLIRVNDLARASLSTRGWLTLRYLDVNVLGRQWRDILGG